MYNIQTMPTKADIMSRVRTVRSVRMLIASPLASGLLGLTLILCISVLVSVGDVVANTMTHVYWSERFTYAFSSLFHSRIIVQALAYLAILASFGVLFNSLRKISFRRFFISFGSTQQI